MGGEQEGNLQLETEERCWPDPGWGCSDMPPPGPSNETNQYAPPLDAQSEGRNPEFEAYNRFQASGRMPNINSRITLTEDSMELCEQAPVLSSAQASDWGFSDVKRESPTEEGPLGVMQMSNGLSYGAVGPPPLGLKLIKSTSFMDLISGELDHPRAEAGEGTMALDVSRKPGQVGANVDSACCNEDETCAAHTCGRMKASNFPATRIDIGSWSYVSKNEGDVVAKFYYAKKKLVWEVLLAGLKHKIEFHWNDIVDMEMTEVEEGGRIDILLSKAPTFSQESDPQPRKHTLWRACKDFTGNQASVCMQHVLYFEGGIFKKHKAKLMECDPRLKSILETAGSRPPTENKNKHGTAVQNGAVFHRQMETAPIAGPRDGTLVGAKDKVPLGNACPATMQASTATKHMQTQANQTYSCKKKKKNPSYTAVRAEPLLVSASCMSYDSNASQAEDAGQEVDAPPALHA